MYYLLASFDVLSKLFLYHKNAQNVKNKWSSRVSERLEQYNKEVNVKLGITYKIPQKSKYHNQRDNEGY